MIKTNIFQCFCNETDRFLECTYISLASKSCNEFFTVKFPTVFKLFRYRVNATSSFAAVTFLTVFKMCRHRVNAVLVSENEMLADSDSCMLHDNFLSSSGSYPFYNRGLNSSHTSYFGENFELRSPRPLPLQC